MLRTFTPSGCLWLNFVLSIGTRRVIRRGAFTSVRQPTQAMGAFSDDGNDHAKPLAWTKDAGSSAAFLRANAK